MPGIDLFQYFILHQAIFQGCVSFVFFLSRIFFFASLKIIFYKILGEMAWVSESNYFPPFNPLMLWKKLKNVRTKWYSKDHPLKFWKNLSLAVNFLEMSENFSFFISKTGKILLEMDTILNCIEFDTWSKTQEIIGHNFRCEANKKKNFFNLIGYNCWRKHRGNYSACEKSFFISRSNLQKNEDLLRKKLL